MPEVYVLVTLLFLYRINSNTISIGACPSKDLGAGPLIALADCLLIAKAECLLIAKADWPMIARADCPFKTMSGWLLLINFVFFQVQLMRPW